jgi:hypothetical protein
MADVDDARRLHNQLWGVAAWVRHSPAPTPVSLGRDDVTSLRTGYIATAKTDGERCCLVIGAVENDASRTYAVRFDRAGVGTRVGLVRARKVALHEDPRADPCEGTLFDCEWMADRREFVLLDGMAICGYDIKPVNDLRRRLQLAAKVGRAVQLHGARIVSKPFLDLKDAGTIDVDDGRNDGIVFMPACMPVQTGRASNIYKWKRHHTVDALFRDGGFLFGQDDDLVPCGSVGIWVDTRGAKLQDGVVVEHPFRVLHARPDKGEVPNQVDTVRAALQHIREAVSHRELLEMIGQLL